jgi:two-component system, NarL family, response regulator DevR
VRMKRVLLVDDHGVFRQGVGLILKERVGIESVQAGSLAEAERMLSGLDGWVDLAVVDLDLPDGDGIALIRTLRKTSPDARVLALTSSKAMERRGRALHEGANEVHLTTSSGEELIAAAERLLGG